MKCNKLLIFITAMIFLFSLSYAFAVEENATELAIDENVEQPLTEDVNNELISAEDNCDVLEAPQVQSIKMGEVTRRFNGAIQYKATFYDFSGNPLPDTNVRFTLDDTLEYEVNTDSNGVALLNILISNGNHKINAFNPVTYNVSYKNIKVFDVITGGKNLIMHYDDGSSYKVKVLDNNGNPVKAGQKVTFTLNGKKYVRSTDKNGFAKLKITLKPGSYHVYANYKDFIVGNYVVVKPVLKGSTFNYRLVKPTIKFKVKFLGKNKKNKLIKIKFNKKNYKAKTNKKGIAKFNLKTPKKRGLYNVVISYKKSKITMVYGRS